MHGFTRLKKLAIGLGIVTFALGGAYVYTITPHHPFAPPESAQGLLDRADQLSWLNRWAEAEPLYAKAAPLFASQNLPSKALYAEVSEIPADESTNEPAVILRLAKALDTPEGRDPATRLRILTILGMIEINYDASLALGTWQQVEHLAPRRGQFALATRAEGEQGIAEFILGDTVTAKNKVVKAWTLSKVENDPAATVRYASVFGDGLVQLRRYKESLIPLNMAISIVQKHPDIAYPTIAIYAKIDALAGLHNYAEALRLATSSLHRLEGTRYDGHKAQVYISRGSIELEEKQSAMAIADFQNAIAISRQIGNNRGIVDAAGLIARTYEQEGDLANAEVSINEAIEANTKIPYELYLVPRNLTIKGEIAAKLRHTAEATSAYRQAIALVNRMLQHAPTTNVQRILLAEMSNAYSGYFELLCSQKRYNEALQILDNIRGRLEEQALEHRQTASIHAPTQAEEQINRLNIALINTDDGPTRALISNAIYTTELSMSPDNLVTTESVARAVSLTTLQKQLSPQALLVEYVLAEPASYVLAITHNSVNSYRLASRETIEADATQYRNEIRDLEQDKPLAQRLFTELLGRIPQYKSTTDLIVIPDGALHLLPFAALDDTHGYVLASHTVDVNPSATVHSLLERRAEQRTKILRPYVGVAAWTQPATSLVNVLRSVVGPQRSELIPLPASKKEVENIAKDLPGPSTILEGADATETNFKDLVRGNTNDVIHLALHGYADIDYPERSALVFAPSPPASASDDGLLQVREIRELHLNSKLVTLSACNTGVGPVGEPGVANLVNAFIEAGADSVVSTLWELSDQSTGQLMKDFYGQLADHHRKVDALRTAQLTLLHKGVPPYFWASFQIVGDEDGTF